MLPYSVKRGLITSAVRSIYSDHPAQSAQAGQGRLASHSVCPRTSLIYDSVVSEKKKKKTVYIMDSWIHKYKHVIDRLVSWTSDMQQAPFCQSMAQMNFYFSTVKYSNFLSSKISRLSNDLIIRMKTDNFFFPMFFFLNHRCLASYFQHNFQLSALSTLFEWQ